MAGRSVGLRVARTQDRDQNQKAYTSGTTHSDLQSFAMLAH